MDAEVRLYDKLFTEANMNAIPEGSDYKDYLNPESVVVRKGCKLEESLKDAKPGEKFQFVRTGFFTPDSKNPACTTAWSPCATASSLQSKSFQRSTNR